jgi:hypothetical protein
MSFMTPTEPTEERRWADARRLEGWAGEARVNLVRLAAIVLFYGHHLVNMFVLGEDPSLTAGYHSRVTLLMLAWAGSVAAIHLCLVRRWLPPGLPYAAALWDTALITVLLAVTADPKSSLALLYFLSIAASALRLSLRLVQVTTLAAAAAYVFYLGYIKYVLELPVQQRLPRSSQVIFVLCLLAAGVLAGQMVRQARRLVVGYPVLVAREQTEE